jgi:hypothetical protein
MQSMRRWTFRRGTDCPGILLRVKGELILLEKGHEAETKAEEAFKSGGARALEPPDLKGDRAGSFHSAGFHQARVMFITRTCRRRPRAVIVYPAAPGAESYQSSWLSTNLVRDR